MHSCFLWCREEKLVSLILRIHGDRERAVATRAGKTDSRCLFSHLNTDPASAAGAQTPPTQVYMCVHIEQHFTPQINVDTTNFSHI